MGAHCAIKHSDMRNMPLNLFSLYLSPSPSAETENHAPNDALDFPSARKRKICYSILMDSIKMAYVTFERPTATSFSPFIFISFKLFRSANKMVTVRNDERQRAVKNDAKIQLNWSDRNCIYSDDGLVVIRLKLIYCRHERKNVVN